jgi:hypothetical protein
MHARLAIAAAVVATSVSAIASADTYIVHERSEGVRYDGYRYREGVDMEGYAGVGYGVGVGARVGGTFSPGVYLGGAFTYYTGNAAFVGGELGYKFWPGYRWELRPYAFVGPAFVRVGDEGFGRRVDQPDIVLAFQPGFLAAYHFGQAYLAAEGRAYVAPNPGALAFFGGIGVNL